MAHIAGKDASLPILSQVLISTENGSLKLGATNLEIGITCFVRGKIEEEGTIAVDARVISEYVNLLPKEVVALESSTDNTVKLSCENYATTMRGINADDFPIIPSLEKENSVTCNASDLKKAIQNTIFATQFNESRPELSGVFIKVTPNESKLCMVATDAYRLAEQTISATPSSQEVFNVIVPLKTMQEVLRIIPDDGQSTITLSVSENQILFATENVELISKIVLGEYPDYKQILPTSWMTKVALDTQDLAKAIKASSIFSTKGINDVVLEFEGASDGKGTVKVSSSNATVGENVVVLNAEYQGEPNRVVLNYRYVIEGLQHLEGGKLDFSLVDSESPCTMRAKKDESYLYLVMPIKQ